MPRTDPGHRRKSRKFNRARVRNFLFTTGPDRLCGGRIKRRHLAGELAVREIEITCDTWPTAFDGLRIGHISDFHLGDLIPHTHAARAIEFLKDQEPDFIACTGDVVDLHHHPAQPILEALAAINAPLGAALVLGNHDELHCANTIAELADDAGLIVLHDEAIRINRDGDSLIVAGISWARQSTACARRVDLACGEFAHLLLAHNPKAFLRAAEIGIPLTLAGHTHGGQIAMKNRPKVNVAITHQHRAGLYESNGSSLYVTAGVGAWFPLRVNCPAEIAIITVRCADQNEQPKTKEK